MEKKIQFVIEKPNGEPLDDLLIIQVVIVETPQWIQYGPEGTGVVIDNVLWTKVVPSVRW